MIECFFDGAFRPIGKHRGGHAGCGFVVYDNGRPIHKRFAYIGNDPQLTCNSAEYAGVILVLRYLLEHGISEAVVYGDSLSAIQQLTRNGRLQLDLYPPHHKGAYYQEAWLLRQKLPKVKFRWIRRELNMIADDLSKLALTLYPRKIEFKLTDDSKQVQ